MALTIGPKPAIGSPGAEYTVWRDIPTAVISDDLNRTGTMAAAIKPLVLGKGFVGQALTVQVMVGGNAALHYALSYAWPGCIVVVDGRGHVDTAVWGGILTVAAEVKGVAGLVVDGAIRDVSELRASSIAVYARGIVPNGPHKGFGGGINVAIQCAGVSVNPGDIIVGDDDGVVVIRPDQVHGLLARCQSRLAKEEAVVENIKAGVSTVELQGLPPAEEFG